MLNSRTEYFARKNLTYLPSYHHTNTSWSSIQKNTAIPQTLQTVPFDADTWVIGWYDDDPRYILITLTHVYYYDNSWQYINLRDIQKQAVLEQAKFAATNLVLSTAEAAITLHLPRHRGRLRDIYTWMTFFKQNFHSQLPPHQFHTEPDHQ